MAANQRLERVKIARLRRRDKEPITGLDYHRVATVTRTLLRVGQHRHRESHKGHHDGAGDHLSASLLPEWAR